ncbi:MAG: hypothetical protein MUP92_00475, partial [Actinobacteria bacterium]|nr:hypothetical protein [Actinomycetota bacterium]
GCLVFGALTAMTEASRTLADALVFMPKVGPLSGQALSAVIVFLASWKLLEFVLRGKEPGERRVFVAMWLMVGVGIVLTFPPVYQSF